MGKTELLEIHPDLADNSAGLAALYAGVLQNLAMVQSADNALEGKTVGVIALSLAAIALVAEKADRWYALTVTGVVLLGSSLVLALLCMRVKSYRSATVSIEEHPEYVEKINKDLLEQIISDAEGSYTDSAGKLEDKARLYQWTVGLFVAGALVSIVSFHFKVVRI